MKIGVTGTQKGMSDRQQYAAYKVLLRLHPTEMHNGLCIGADEQFLRMANNMSIHVVGHPPVNRSKMTSFRPLSLRMLEALPYLERNKNIVKGSQVLVVAPKERVQQLRSGTWATYRFARAPIMNRLTWIVYPEGDVLVQRPDGTTEVFTFEEI